MKTKTPGLTPSNLDPEVLVPNRAARRARTKTRLGVRWAGRDWYWSPTSVPTPTRRMKRRAANRRARAARKLQRNRGNR